MELENHASLECLVRHTIRLGDELGAFITEHAVVDAILGLSLIHI